jgi:hypothetical protein
MVARIRKPLKFRVLNRIVARAIENRGQQPGCDIQSTPTEQTLDHDDAFALDVVDRSVLIVVVIVVMIGVIGVAAMVASVIGHWVSDCRAPDASYDGSDRPANNSPGNRAADPASD